MPPIFRFLNYRIEKKNPKTYCRQKKLQCCEIPPLPPTQRKKYQLAVHPFHIIFTGIALTRPGHQRNI